MAMAEKYSGSRRECDLTPEQFCEIFPGITVDQAQQLRSRRLELTPDLNFPLAQFAKNVQALPSSYRDPFIRKALDGIIPENAFTDIKLNPQEFQEHLDEKF